MGCDAGRFLTPSISRKEPFNPLSHRIRFCIEAIETFVASWNQHATPFEWTKEEVHQQQMKHSYSNLRN
jgi:hypothetical protein